MGRAGYAQDKSKIELRDSEGIPGCRIHELLLQPSGGSHDVTKREEKSRPAGKRLASEGDLTKASGGELEEGGAKEAAPGMVSTQATRCGE